jgi:hypothetical protein
MTTKPWECCRLRTRKYAGLLREMADAVRDAAGD